MAGRRCTVCPRSSMRRNVRHLHELAAGSRFRFESGNEETFTLIEVGEGSAVISGGARERARSFRPRFGDEDVTIRVVDPGLRRCAPGAQVVPV